MDFPAFGNPTSPTSAINCSPFDETTKAYLCAWDRDNPAAPADCDYVASSGLRAILGAQKKMNSLQGTMVVKNVVSDVMEVFEMTGFADILTFE